MSPTKDSSLWKGQNNWISVHGALLTTTIIFPAVETDAPIYSKQPATARITSTTKVKPPIL